MTTSTKAPESLGRFRITGVIGEGVSGIVYKAFEPELQRVIALKVLNGFVRGDSQAAEAFAGRLAEQAQAVVRLAHPGIVTLHEIGEAEGRPYVAMEYVSGMDLGQWLAAAPLPPLPLLLQVMDQLLDALEAAHRAGVRHGDIKPANVIITSTGAIKITDFGLARAEGRTGARAGLAPEYQTGRLIDHRVDIYAAGVILYRMLVGRDPFSDELAWGGTESLGAHARPPSTIAESGRPSTFDVVVARALAHEPGQRFGSAAEFRDLLRDATDPRLSIHGVRDVTIDSPTPPIARGGLARPAPSGDAAASLPVLTIAIPESVLSMPAYDPWAHATTARPGRRVDERKESDLAPELIPNDDHVIAAIVEQGGRERRDAITSAAAAAANAAVTAAAMAAEAARARARVAAPSLTLSDVPPAGTRGGLVITSAVSRPADTFSDFAPLPELDDELDIDGMPRTIHGGDIQLAHPVEGDLIPAEALRRVLRILSAHFGASAGDVLKQVAGRARTVSELHTMLLDQAGAGVDKKKMAKQLKAVAKLPL